MAKLFVEPSGVKLNELVDDPVESLKTEVTAKVEKSCPAVPLTVALAPPKPVTKVEPLIDPFAPMTSEAVPPTA